MTDHEATHVRRPRPTDDDAPIPQAVVGKLGTLDRFLPVWIGLAMAAGLLIGRMAPGSAEALEAMEIDGISLPIAIGLLVMMYPPLAKVRYGEMGSLTGDRRLIGLSLLLNWIIGPVPQEARHSAFNRVTLPSALVSPLWQRSRCSRCS